VPRGPPVEAEVLGLFDVVLDVDVGAVPGVESGDLPVAGVGGDQLVAAPELVLPFGGPLAVAGVQRLVTHDDPQPGDLLVSGAEVEQAGQVGDERVVHEVAVLVDPRRPRVGG
jgi:hypothetical protein